MWQVILFAIILLFISYKLTKGDQKRRNTIKYNEQGLEIPEVLCNEDMEDTDEDMEDTYEDMEEYCRVIKGEEASKYIKINWDDIISWEYTMRYRHRSPYYSNIEVGNSGFVILYITTIDKCLRVEHVYRALMKKWFKKYAQGKQIINIFNKIETAGTIVAWILFIAIILYMFRGNINGMG